MFPDKLRKGDEIRVISPAKSLAIVALDQQKLAVERLNRLGFRVTFSTYAHEDSAHISNSIEHRVNDLHEAFLDENVKAILTTLGGYDSNQLLSSIDFETIRQNPKIFCGFSDITILTNSIYKKAGLVTYSGPHFSSFGMEKGIDYTYEYFKNIVTKSEPISIEPAEEWSDDLWYINQEDRRFHSNQGYEIIHEGSASGTSIGGNLCTFNLLQGTGFMPPLEESILFLEDDMLSNPPTFDRDLQSLIHQKGFEKVNGIVIGRFQKASQMDTNTLKAIIHSKKELDRIPVIADVDFGHTTPRFTFPIGGRVEIKARDGNASIKIVEH
ncbi:S66 peptidase family protein [Halobacillus litoralis]|uniref:S66 family peptidase n=1 Tax=Halobacillus litoralis TaxID=45668 RepID=UPI001CFEDB91|nr:S66 peptidase family protein [Halobacillus litoralis]